MERPRLELVAMQDFVPPVVREIRPPRNFNMRCLRLVQTLPDNVYLFPQTPPLEPEAA